MSTDKKDLTGKPIVEEEKVEENVDEVVPQDLTLRLAEITHLLSLPNTIVPAEEAKSLREEAFNIVKTSDMTFFYQSIFGKDVNAAVLKTMQENNKTKFDEFEKEMETAVSSGGESDVQDINVRKARYLALIGDKEPAYTLLEQCLDKAVGGGARIDISMSLIRLALAFNEINKLSTYMTSTAVLIEKEGDWERRNRFGVYKGVLALIDRRFDTAATLFVSAVPTFTCTELINFNTAVTYAILSAIAHLERTKLKEQVIDCHDVIQTLLELPTANTFISSLYKCNYKQLFSEMLNVAVIMQRDRFMAPHVDFYLKQVRVVAYSQFIASYRSITLDSMATLFGVSVQFIDRELSSLIAVGRLKCKIDAVDGVIVRDTKDHKNMDYAQLLQSGDALLNKVNKITQKLKTA